MGKVICECEGCQRRDFIKKLGILAGAGAIAPDLLAMLPNPVSPKLIPDKTGAIKVRVFFSLHKEGDVQKVPDWPNHGYDFRPAMKNMIDSLNLEVPGVEFIPTTSNGAKHARSVVEEDEKSGEIKGYVIIQLNPWVYSIQGVLDSTNKAVLYTALPYAGDGGWLMYNAKLVGKNLPNYVGISAFDFSKVTAVAKAFETLKNGTVADFYKQASATRDALIPPDTIPADLKVIDDKVACLTPEAALAELKGTKIISVEREKKPEYVTALAETFGITIQRVSFEELNNEARSVPEAEAKAIASDWADSAKRIEFVTGETLLGSAKIYLGMKRVLAKYNAKAITINCLGGCYGGKLDAYPCLGFMQLQDEGIMGVCENDLDSTITMLAFTALTKGRMGFVSDPVIDMPNRVISYAHCVSTRRFFGPKGPKAPYEILTHSEDRMGASVRAFAPVGQPVTTVKIMPIVRKIAVHTGITVANDLDDRACRTKIVARVTGDYSKIEAAWQTFGWHRVTFLGDFKDDVVAFAKKIGYEVVYES